MKNKISNKKRRQYTRKIFKLGNNGKTSSYVVTIPKNFLETLNVENNNKVIVSLENENDHFFIKILKLDEHLTESISKSKMEKRKTNLDSQEFENWD